MSDGTHVIAVVTCGHLYLFQWQDGDDTFQLRNRVVEMCIDDELPEFTDEVALNVIQRIWSART